MSPRDRTIALLGGLALIMLILVALMYAEFAGRSLGTIMPTLLGFATPTIVSLFAAAGARVDLGRLENKVNGNYDELAKRNEDQAALLAELTTRYQSDTGRMPALNPETVQRLGRHRAADDGR